MRATPFSIRAAAVRWAFGLAVCLGHAAFAGDTGGPAVVLRNTLPVEGPTVTLTPRFGLFYHPGCAFVLEGIVRPAGEDFQGLTVQEGNPDRGPRYECQRAFSKDRASNFLLPLRAPSGGAKLTLQVWKYPPGSEHRRNLFVASLANELKPVDRNESIVLQIGRCPGPPPPSWHVATVEPEQMPDEAWMYENVDLVVVASGGLGKCSEAARQALRTWVCGGGRVLVASMDPKARLESVQAGLTPLPANIQGELKNDFDWWSRNAGLKESDVRREDNGTMVYAQYRLGLGAGLLFFPNEDPQTLLKFWPDALKLDLFKCARTATDERVRNAPFDFFPNGTIAPSRRNQGIWYAAVGGLCFIFLLLYASTVKTRYMAAGLAIGGVSLFAALLGRWFKAPEGVISRIEVLEIPADGRAARRSEWAYVDGLQDASSMVVRGPFGGTLAELHAQTGEIATAGTDLDLDGPLRLTFRPPCPAPLPPLFEAVRIEPDPSVDSRAANPEGAPTLRVSELGTIVLPLHAAVTGREGFAKGVILLRGMGGLLLWHPKEWPGTELAGTSYESPAQAIKVRLPELKESEVEARVKALAWVIAHLRPSGRDALITFEEVERTADDPDPLVRVEGVNLEEGRPFRIRVLEARIEDR
ncbi:MAG: hypothetical protein HY291_17650 [Planctomycetes bacterium]|nr:hypothetical protein [Planctomycetota bacterium]